jgi:hypothetical protein
VRYADDFVVMSRYPGKRLYGWIEAKLDYQHFRRLGLKPLEI